MKNLLQKLIQPQITHILTLQALWDQLKVTIVKIYQQEFIGKQIQNLQLFLWQNLIKFKRVKMYFFDQSFQSTRKDRQMDFSSFNQQTLDYSRNEDQYSTDQRRFNQHLHLDYQHEHFINDSANIFVVDSQNLVEVCDRYQHTYEQNSVFSQNNNDNLSLFVWPDDPDGCSRYPNEQVPFSSERKLTKEEEKRLQKRQKQRETKNVLTNFRNIMKMNHPQLLQILPKKNNLSIPGLKEVIRNLKSRRMIQNYLRTKTSIQDIFASRIQNKKLLLRYFSGVIRLVLNPEKVSFIK